MRKLILLLLYLAGNSLQAQNYQNICSPGITFYKSSDGDIKAFRQDSAFPEGNNDTLFISYMTLRERPGQTCFRASSSSVLGRKVCKKQDGTFFFFNLMNDTLTLKTQASLNSSWKFCSLPEGSRIDATVTAISQDSVLGLADNVKTISFQAKDSNGVNIQHTLNQKTMKLSQHYGILKTFDLYFTPDYLGYNINYLLAGKTNPVMGIQNVTWPDIYDFEIGDEFHYTGEFYIIRGPKSNLKGGISDWKIIKRVLGKEITGNLDGINYTFEHCKLKYDEFGTSEATHDTIVESYNFLALANDTTIGQLPESIVGNGLYAPKFVRSIQFIARQTQEVTNNAYFYYSYNDIWCFPEYPNLPSYMGYHYSKGLGQTYMINVESGAWTHVRWENMVYYKKGSEVWGTPLSTNCMTLLPVEEKTKPVLSDLRIIPNPVETQAEIYLDNVVQTDLHYILMNVIGEVVQNKEITTNPFTIHRLELQSGLYFIFVVDNKNTILFRKKIILE